ncbi:MAG: O-antigen ligase family protein, partial [Thermoleophilum sp.]|nr:O-antigen ligase family protein [Thermoleophilum sp.]
GRELEGKVLAWAAGPIVTGTREAPTNVKVGRVLGGTRVRADIPYALIIKDNRKSIKTAALLQTVVGRRFFRLEGVDQKGLAEAKTDQYLVLHVPKVYHQNQARYFQVLQLLPVVDTPELRAQRLEQWKAELLDPSKAGVAALKLEGLGRNAIPTLKTGLESPDPNVRFFAAEALGYLNDASGADVLAAAAVAAVAVAQRRRGRALAAVIVLCGLAVAYFSAIAPPEVRARIINPGSGTGRTDLWTVATRMIEANPLLGVGVGNFPEEAGRYLLVPGLLRETQFIVVDPKVAHNAYLEVAAETGLPGLALFIALLGTAFASCRRAWLRAEAIGDRHLSVAARALFVALVAYAVAIVWLSQQYGKQLWLLLALAFALPDLAAAPDRQRALSPQASQRRRRWTAPRARRRAATATTS